VRHLDVLPGGSRSSNPGELLASANLAEVFSWAEQRYERILCDVSPILAVADCALLGRWLDGILLVVGADESDRVRTARARDLLRSMKCPLVGVVVNRLHARSAYGYSYCQSYSSPVPLQPERLSPGTAENAAPFDKAA